MLLHKLLWYFKMKWKTRMGFYKGKQTKFAANYIEDTWSYTFFEYERTIWKDKNSYLFKPRFEMSIGEFILRGPGLRTMQIEFEWRMGVCQKRLSIYLWKRKMWDKRGE